MMIRNLLVCSLLSLPLLAGGCHKSDPAEQMVSMMEDMGNAIDSAKDDCGKMADNLEAVTKKYDIAKLKAEGEKMKGDKAQSEAMMKKYGPRMEKVMPKLMGAMKCADDPKMKAVQSKFDGMM